MPILCYVTHDHVAIPLTSTSYHTVLINITPKSKIELISADLNIDSIHEISDDKLNDSFVVGFGEENIVTVSLATFSDKSFQVPIRLTDGRYTNSQLANEIERTFNNSNLYVYC